MNKPTEHRTVTNVSVMWCCEAALLEIGTRAALLELESCESWHPLVLNEGTQRTGGGQRKCRL